MEEYYRYAPSPSADLLLAQLWARLQADNELADLYSDPEFPLSAIFEASTPPRNELVYRVDDEGIWFAFWVTSVAGGAMVSVYVRPDRRADVQALVSFRRCLQFALRAYHVLLGITRETLLPLHRRLGYSIAGCVPGILGGKDGYLVVRAATEKEKAAWHSSQQAQEPEQAQEPLQQQLELALGLGLPALPVPPGPELREPERPVVH